MSTTLLLCELKLYANTLSDRFSIKLMEISNTLQIYNGTNGHGLELDINDPDILEKSTAFMKPKVSWKIPGDTPN